MTNLILTLPAVLLLIAAAATLANETWADWDEMDRYARRNMAFWTAMTWLAAFALFGSLFV